MMSELSIDGIRALAAEHRSGMPAAVRAAWAKDAVTALLGAAERLEAVTDELKRAEAQNDPHLYPEAIEEALNLASATEEPTDE